MRHSAATIVLALLCSSCGDPLVEGDYRGEALIELEGTIRVQDALSDSEAAAVRVGLLWVGAAQQGDLTQSRSESSFPARYAMRVFARPPLRAMNPIPSGDGLYGTARIVLYIDADGDDQLDALERVVGASTDRVLTYFTSSQPTSLVRNDVRIVGGYQVMELFNCEERLEDKATFGGSASGDVDLTLASSAAAELLDLDCDEVSDDYCYDLRLQVQNDPANGELVDLYEQQCDVVFEPEFNNSDEEDPPDETDPTEEEDDLPGGPDQFCQENPDHAECRENPDEPADADTVVDECVPLLGGAIGVGAADQQEAYWRFAQCTGEYDPCRQVDWDGTAERWMQYQLCIFDALRAHHEQWCRDLNERIEMSDGDDMEFLQSEFERADCSEAI